MYFKLLKNILIRNATVHTHIFLMQKCNKILNKLILASEARRSGCYREDHMKDCFPGEYFLSLSIKAGPSKFQ